MSEEEKRKYIKIALIFSLILSIVTLLDFGLPRQKSTELVIAKRAYNQTHHRTVSSERKFGFITSKAEYPCSSNIHSLVKEDNEVLIIKTRILKDVRGIEVGNIWMQNDFSIYKFGIFPITLWVATLVATLLWRFNGKFGYLETATILSTMVGLFVLVNIILNKYI
jgi:hypothetical protein